MTIDWSKPPDLSPSPRAGRRLPAAPPGIPPEALAQRPSDLAGIEFDREQEAMSDAERSDSYRAALLAELAEYEQAAANEVDPQRKLRAERGVLDVTAELERLDTAPLETKAAVAEETLEQRVERLEAELRRRPS